MTKRPVSDRGAFFVEFLLNRIDERMTAFMPLKNNKIYVDGLPRSDVSLQRLEQVTEDYAGISTSDLPKIWEGARRQLANLSESQKNLARDIESELRNRGSLVPKEF